MFKWRSGLLWLLSNKNTSALLSSTFVVILGAYQIILNVIVYKLEHRINLLPGLVSTAILYQCSLESRILFLEPCRSQSIPNHRFLLQWQTSRAISYYIARNFHANLILCLLLVGEV
jgi:hypothetical protein